MASKAGSSVMVTDSLAFCANPANSGITSFGFGAAHASAGASSASHNGKLHFFMETSSISIYTPDFSSDSEVD
jgi:hypothetical protein